MCPFHRLVPPCQIRYLRRGLEIGCLVAKKEKKKKKKKRVRHTYTFYEREGLEYSQGTCGMRMVGK